MRHLRVRPACMRRSCMRGGTPCRGAWVATLDRAIFQPAAPHSPSWKWCLRFLMSIKELSNV
nr:MAG TPA: hypothetical protein [Caudoviricetes sp.]